MLGNMKVSWSEVLYAEILKFGQNSENIAEILKFG